MTNSPDPEKMKRPNLSEANKGTRWKKGHVHKKNPDAAKPYSVRGGLRWMANQPLDTTNAETLNSSLQALMQPQGKGKVKKKPLAGRVLAGRMFERALKKAEPRLCEVIIDNIDGKVLQPIADIPAPDQLSPDEFPTLEEANETWQRFIKS